MSLIDFNEFVLQQHGRSDRDERLVQLLATQWYLAKLALEAGSKRDIDDELEFATRQAIELHGGPMDAVMTRLVLLSSGGSCVELGASGTCVSGQERLSLLEQLTEDLLAYLRLQTPPVGRVDEDLKALVFDLLTLHQQLSIEQDAPTQAALTQLRGKAIDRITDQAPWLCDLMITVPQAQEMAAVVKRYIATVPAPVATYIKGSVWAVLTVNELCTLSRDVHNINLIARANRVRTFSHDDYVRLLEASVNCPEGPVGTLLCEWADKLPVELLCTYIPKAEAGRKLPILMERILRQLHQREDVSDEQRIQVLMSSRLGIHEVRQYLDALSMSHEQVSEFILSAKSPINTLSAHMLLSPALTTGSNTDLQIKDTYLDYLLKASNLDLFARPTAGGSTLGERVRQAIELLPLTWNAEKGVTLLYGSAGKWGHDANFDTGAKIRDQLISRYDKQVERLMRRQNSKRQSPRPPVDDHLPEVL